ncbi:MAG: transglycosylase SLT domain-containing protein [Bryobacteraceae bacterium]
MKKKLIKSILFLVFVICLLCNATYKTNPLQKEIDLFNKYDKISNNELISFYVIQYSKQFNVPSDLVMSIIKTESEFQVVRWHINTNGTIDRSLMALNSASFPDLKREQFYDIKTNLYYGIKYLSYLQSKTNNTVLTVMAYNGGLYNTLHHKLQRSTYNYVVKVMKTNCI